jgi:hypothetical protein
MKKKFIPVLVVIVSFSVFYFSTQKTTSEKLREKHEAFLKQTPYTKTGKLSKKKRKSLGLPPNAYNEQMWHYTLDPNTGRPMPEKVSKIQENLKIQHKGLSAKTPGDATNQWIDRGPNNLGGRTRGIMFDPNDTENKRVFAGGVSGGLWVNEDITNANSSWTLVPGIGANISVTVITYDPNNTNIFYIGSGESYTSGNAVGRGIWRSLDGGVTWNNIFGGADGTLSSNNVFVNGIFFVNDIVARNVSGVTEIYAAISGGFYRDSSNPGQFLGIEQGLYKSINNGNNWERLNVKDNENLFVNPNDIEIDLENNVWLATTRNSFGPAGGKIFKSVNGTDFTLINTLPSAARTEIEVSSLDANKLWAVVNDADSGQVANIYATTDGFENFTQLNEPNDVDNDILETDYTRGQAFYNLPIEADANDNLFIGGIDLFRSTDNGTSWTQLSKWSNNNDLRTLSVPLVHADQHAIVFRPGTTSEVVFGNDGGVYYTSNILEEQTSLIINERNLNYNVAQFYFGAIDNIDIENGDDIVGGTQDNGTPVSFNSQANANSFPDPFGGDGGFTEIDDESGYMIQSYPQNTHNFITYPSLNPSSFKQLTTSQDDDEEFLGNFINCAVLDKNLDILYSNATLGNDFKIERVSGFLPEETQEKTFLSDDILGDNPSTMQISPFSTTSSKVYVGLENSKLVRIDDANTETPVFNDISGDEFVGSLSDIEFGTNENEIFVTIHNYGVESIWFTSNGGTSWRSLEGNLPDLPVKCILQNPLNTNELIVGTELGIWKTDDYTIAEPVWEQSFNGMSDVTVVDLDLRSIDNTILASTHGRGLFTSQFTDGAATINDVLNDKILFTVYPTISNGNFTIFGKRSMDKTTIQIFSITGKKVFSGDLNFSKNMKQTVSINANSGVYIVNLETADGNKFSNKIIIE